MPFSKPHGELMVENTESIPWTTVKYVKLKREKVKSKNNIVKEVTGGTSLVVQWLRIHLPMQGTWVQSLVRDLKSHKLYSATTTEHTSSVAQVLQLARSLHTPQWKILHAATETQCSQINKWDVTGSLGRKAYTGQLWILFNSEYW